MYPSLGVAAGESGVDSAVSQQILSRYLRATQGEAATPPSGSMEVDINAFVPKLKENGRLHALRVISQFGRISYRVLGFQGSNTVKNQVIARYLQAEQQGQGSARLAITPANYKFKLRGERQFETGKQAYVFGLTPRKPDVGLFKGEIWLDSESCLPVYEWGRLVKNPSIFFKRVDFERAFSVQYGKAVPQSMTSVITTRVVGKVRLEVSYFNYSQNADQENNNPSVLMMNSLSSN